MPKQFSIQKAESSNSEQIIDLLGKLYIELGEEKESLGFLTEDFINTTINEGVVQIYFAKMDSEIAGIFTVTESQAIYAGGKFGSIDEMYILAEFREQKMGAEIIKFIKDIARKRGWKRVDVTAPTETQWERTRKFYEQNGFIFTGPKYKLKINP